MADAPILTLTVFILATIGTLFMLISAIGIVRLPDIFSRMHAAGKAATLGVTCLLAATGIYFQDTMLYALILFFFITAPIATTSMARAAYRTMDLKEAHLSQDDMAKKGSTIDRPDEASQY